MFAVNVRAVVAAVLEAAKIIPDGGRIITVGSINGEAVPFPGGAFYAGSKGAVRMLTKGWARDLGERGVTVNVVQPGPIDTDLNPADGPFGAVLTGMTALKRYGKPEDVAELVAFLAGPGRRQHHGRRPHHRRRHDRLRTRLCARRSSRRVPGQREMLACRALRALHSPPRPKPRLCPIARVNHSKIVRW
jgi:NAD(P)-dependent dehydrogenase (short-subunit alcohol dehydrogenase family)